MVERHITRHIARLLVSTLGLCASACLVSGSSQAASASPAVAVVMGERQNSVALSAGDLRGLVERLVAEGAELRVVVCDGRPALSGEARLVVSGPNGLYRTRSAAREVALAMGLLLDAKASVPEADTLGAIALAGRAVITHPGPRRVVVIDSGLSTLGALEFQDGVLSDTPRQVVAFLKSTDELPDLHGIGVTWYGLGQVSGRQAPPTTAVLRRLSAIWVAVLRASGAAKVHIVQTPLVPGRPDPHLPPVALVSIPEVAHLVGHTASTMSVPLSAQEVDFVPGEAVYLDPLQAQAVLAAVAHEIVAGHYTKVRLTGTAALAGWQALSQARADAVERTLVADGVPASSISAVGVGERFAGFVPDVSASGVLEPVQAEEDRLVIVTASRP